MPDKAGRTLSASRLLDAPRPAVFRMFSESALIDAWWGPEGFTNSSSLFEFREGGRWHVVMRGPDGAEFANDWRFERIEPDRRIVLRHVGPMHEFVLTVNLGGEGAKTALEWRMDFAAGQLDPAHEPLIKAANEQNLDRLQAALVADGTAARMISISRMVDAPRELVFSVFTEPRHIDAWWGPEGFRNETHEMGFFAGGLWRYTMHGPDGKDWPNWIRYTAITPPELIAYDHGGEIDEPAHFSGSIRLEAQGGKTLVTLSLLLVSAEDRDAKIKFGAVAGGEQTLARLDAYAAGQAALAPAQIEDKPFIISRSYDASRELLFDCFTHAGRLAKWWGPKGVVIVGAKVDLRPGGAFHYGMQAADGPLMWGRQVYREITPPSKIVLVNSFSDEKGGLTRHPGAPEWPIELLVTFTFEDEGAGRTRLTVRMELMSEATDTERQTFLGGFGSLTMGWTGTLDQLQAYLKAA